MKAMIFAAGLGTRLRPFTLHHPKALVPVAGVPMLGRVITKLKERGIREFVVNVHHFAGQIVDYIEANANFGCTMHISDESALLLDTGGGILAARRWLDADSPFVVHNADILTDVPIDSMASAFSTADADATLLAAPRMTSRYLLFDSNMRMHGWTNVATGAVRPQGLDATFFTPLAFGGVHIISPRIFPALEQYARTLSPAAPAPFSITDFYISAAASLDIRGYRHPSPYMWHDIGKPDSLAAAEADLVKK